MNANKTCGTEANANECQKIACSVFVAQANKHAFHWLFVGCPNECTSTSVWLRTNFSLKYRLHTDSVRLFTEHTPHKRMKANAVHLQVHIMCFACVFAFVSHSRTDVDSALCTNVTLFSYHLPVHTASQRCCITVQHYMSVPILQKFAQITLPILLKTVPFIWNGFWNFLYSPEDMQILLWD